MRQTWHDAHKKHRRDSPDWVLGLDAAGTRWQITQLIPFVICAAVGVLTLVLGSVLWPLRQRSVLIERMGIGCVGPAIALELIAVVLLVWGYL